MPWNPVHPYLSAWWPDDPVHSHGIPPDVASEVGDDGVLVLGLKLQGRRLPWLLRLLDRLLGGGEGAYILPSVGFFVSRRRLGEMAGLLTDPVDAASATANAVDFELGRGFHLSGRLPAETGEWLSQRPRLLRSATRTRVTRSLWQRGRRDPILGPWLARRVAVLALDVTAQSRPNLRASQPSRRQG